MLFRRRKGLSFSDTGRRGFFRTKALARKILILVGEIAIVLFCAFLIVYLAGMKVTMLGMSMEPVLSDGDSVLINRMAYYIGTPQPGELVVFTLGDGDDESYYIKRVAAGEGDVVSVEDGTLLVNGEAFEYTDGVYIENPGLAEESITIGKNEYFVIGDNVNESSDSRLTYIGNVSGDNIIGRAWLKFNSLFDFGFVR